VVVPTPIASPHINLKIKRTPKTVFRQNGFWYHGNNVFYHVDHFDSRNNILSGLTIYIIDDHFRILKLVKAAQAYWRNGQWQFEDTQEESLAPQSSQIPQTPQQLLQETPEDFTLVDVEPEEFSSQQLRDYIADLQRKGIDTTAYQVDLRLKGSVPLAVFAMTLLGAALAIPGARQLPVATAIGFALMGGFSYWLLLALTISLGHSGLIPPLFAAWSANSINQVIGISFPRVNKKTYTASLPPNTWLFPTLCYALSSLNSSGSR
jgi:lipopolysaccharide export system permease protein